MSKNTVSAAVFAENDVIALELDGLVIIDQPLVTTRTWQNSLRSEIGKQSSYTRCVFWACVPQKIKVTHIMSLWTFTQSDQPDPTTHVIQQWQRTEKKINTWKVFFLLFFFFFYVLSPTSQCFAPLRLSGVIFLRVPFVLNWQPPPRWSLPSAACHAGAICPRKKNVRLRLLYFLLTLFLLIFVSSTLIWHRVKVHCYWNQNKKQQQKKSPLDFCLFILFIFLVLFFDSLWNRCYWRETEVLLRMDYLMFSFFFFF